MSVLESRLLYELLAAVVEVIGCEEQVLRVTGHHALVPLVVLRRIGGVLGMLRQRQVQVVSSFYWYLMLRLKVLLLRAQIHAKALVHISVRLTCCRE